MLKRLLIFTKDSEMLKRLLILTTVFGTLASTNASALIVTASTANCGGFSTCDDSAFVAAAGVPLTFNDFSVDRFGGVLPSNANVNGNVYSADFTLSSGVGSFGGVNSALVRHANGSGFDSEVGPTSGFTGLLNIDFLFPLSALGFGTVTLGDNGVAFETISLFGPLGLLGTFNARFSIMRGSWQRVGT
ncbi:MAG: hypothetical protein ACREXR_07495 [Gammaproteobacteria bacterium]